MILSLFDESGNMLRPWMKAGYQCVAVDIQNERRTEGFSRLGQIHYINTDLFSTIADIITEISSYGEPSIIFGFPPCTDLASSGAAHFKSKFEKDPDVFKKALYLARVTENVANVYNVPWMIENPIGKLSTLYRRPDFIFSPYEFGGYLPEDDAHPRWPEYIKPRDAYPKRTCIWCGNRFIFPQKMPVEVEPGYSTQFYKLGGKSAKTKKIRSETPRGFAQAVFEANK